MIDASHANSQKNPQNQLGVCENVGTQLAAGEERIVGVMVESHLVAGRQDLEPGRALVYGQSITDALHRLGRQRRPARRARRQRAGTSRQGLGHGQGMMRALPTGQRFD